MQTNNFEFSDTLFQTPPAGNDPKARSLAQALAPFANTNYWTKESKVLTKWSPDSKNVDVSIGSGSGQEKSPFSVTLADFVKLCVKAEFSPPFLRKLIGRCSKFEYHFTFEAADQPADPAIPKILELSMSNYENDSFTLLLRYDIETGHVRAVVFLKLHDPLRGKKEAITIKNFTSYLDQQAPALRGDPFLIANCVLSFYQHHFSVDYAKWRADLYGVEAKLGVTERAAIFKNAGYEGVSFDYDTLNARVAWLAARAADTTLSASTLRDQASALLRLSDLLEDQRGSKQKISQRREEIQSTILRADLYLRNSVMVDAALTSMRAVLYNRITKHDSNSMKTIAVVTLFFLPGTFVSAIFSTGVFNFFANKDEQNQTISRWAWVYLLTCLLLTAIVLVLWLCWYKWGDLWIESLHLKWAHTNADKSKHNKSTGSAADELEQEKPAMTVEICANPILSMKDKSKDLEKGDDTSKSDGNGSVVETQEDLVREIERFVKAAHESERSMSEESTSERS
jgi:hypothetical protein